MTFHKECDAEHLSPLQRWHESYSHHYFSDCLSLCCYFGRQGDLLGLSRLSVELLPSPSSTQLATVSRTSEMGHNEKLASHETRLSRQLTKHVKQAAAVERKNCISKPQICSTWANVWHSWKSCFFFIPAATCATVFTADIAVSLDTRLCLTGRHPSLQEDTRSEQDESLKANQVNRINCSIRGVFLLSPFPMDSFIRAGVFHSLRKNCTQHTNEDKLFTRLLSFFFMTFSCFLRSFFINLHLERLLLLAKCSALESTTRYNEHNH